MKQNLIDRKTLNVVVTGGNNGIGYQTVKGLYTDGHNVIFGSRSKQKNQQAHSTITNGNGGTLQHSSLDLAKRKSIEEFAQFVKTKFPHIDILINNAGVYLQERTIGELGIEQTIGINHFGPFYLTYQLFEHVQKAQKGRIINVSSQFHYDSPNNILDDLQCKNNYNKADQYNKSKFMNVLFTVGLNNLFKKKQITHLKTAALHPGLVNTGIGGEGLWKTIAKYCCCCLCIPPDQGARTSLYLSRVAFTQIRSGQFYNSDTKWRDMDKRARNVELVNELWSLSERMYDIKFD